MRPHLPPELPDPDAPGLDEVTRRQRRLLAEFAKLGPEELRALAVKAGIMTPDGELTEFYKDDSPSPYRDALSGSALDFPILDVLRAPEVQTPLRYEAVAAELGQRWAVAESEVLVRLRRLSAYGFVDEPENLCFRVTEKGRAATP
ncbi:hypothetical protein [Polyangium aurulentum]|uniref:hypothetical protein n=1 Tax=Polyangium aurulentum TaxID=2567896 RepID=UPI0010AEAD4A|nr:hypothetical protein [Polyangium aurulentum]UQA60052.1 hypothetical protein E8A73_006075 [Polyangium aurulentum]